MVHNAMHALSGRQGWWLVVAVAGVPDGFSRMDSARVHGEGGGFSQKSSVHAMNTWFAKKTGCGEVWVFQKRYSCTGDRRR